MNRTWTSLLATTALLTLGLVACGGDDGDPQALGGAAGAGAASGGGSAGSGGEAGAAGQGLVSQDSAISDCGGFNAGQRGPVGYCDAELLMWTYDEATHSVALLDRRVMLNCCGEHSFDVYQDASTQAYEAWEIDAPEVFEGNPSRCNCSCVFDFETTIIDVRTSSIELVLMRHVTDAGDPQQVWAGTIDLSAGAGEIVLDDQPMDYGCMEY